MRPLGVVLLLAGCEGVLPAPDFEQMIDQHKLRPYETSAQFSDGRAMRTPPSGTIARGQTIDARVQAKNGDGSYVTQIPIVIDRDALVHGRWLFETYCAACHGMAGDGQSLVARHMELRRPPSLVTTPVTQFPVGRVFEVSSLGYALMPSYASQLSVEERWQVVAYLQALQLSRHARLDDLPADVRAAAEAALAHEAPK